MSANPASPKKVNSAVLDWNGPHGLPEFNKMEDADYRPAFDHAIALHNQEIDAIAGDASDPDLENTIGALERCGKALSRVSALFWNRAGAHANDVIKAVEREIAPIMSRHFSAIGQNAALFARIDSVWERRAQLGIKGEDLRVLEDRWKGFVKSGAKLEKPQQERLAEINEKLALLGTQFGQNVLADEAEWTLHLGEQDELAGLPDFLLDAMAEAAREHGHESGWCVTLSRSIIEPFLTFSERRDLREAAFAAWTSRGEGEHDNWSLISEILNLRAEKANLLGYSDYAALKLDDTMAKTPQAVSGLLQPVWDKAVEKAGEEAEALAGLIAEEGRNHAVEPWDWRYYADKLRQRTFDFSETALKPYLQLENIIAACFDVAGRLFGLRFKAMEGFAAWHPDVRAFEVFDADGTLRAIFLSDYFARASKRSGAWMSSLQSQHGLDGGQIPFVYNVMNFAKPAKGEPALLSLDDARTLFHEFGHALHGMLSEVKWPSQSGTSVARDFVELPSQLYEHWLMVPEILEEYAVHYHTGESIPKALLDKVLAAQKFDAGFRTVEFTASALVDMAYHTAGEVTDPQAFEAQTLERLNMPREIVMRHRSPHFLHVFSGDGYSAGYYSYMWSEVLDSDAFRAFEEAGNPFDEATARRLREHVYSTGDSVDAEETYKAFRGQMPSPEAMMQDRGLV